MGERKTLTRYTTMAKSDKKYGKDHNSWRYIPQTHLIANHKLSCLLNTRWR